MIMSSSSVRKTVLDNQVLQLSQEDRFSVRALANHYKKDLERATIGPLSSIAMELAQLEIDIEKENK